MTENKELPKVSEERKSYNTTLRPDLLRRLRVRAAMLDKRQNVLIEEAIEDLLKKYETPAE
jgi:predicted transcriptional regulator